MVSLIRKNGIFLQGCSQGAATSHAIPLFSFNPYPKTVRHCEACFTAPHLEVIKEIGCS